MVPKYKNKNTKQKMNTHFLKSGIVCGFNNEFSFQIGFKHYNFGLIVEKNHVRLMLIWWHICFSY